MRNPGSNGQRTEDVQLFSCQLLLEHGCARVGCLLPTVCSRTHCPVPSLSLVIQYCHTTITVLYTAACYSDITAVTIAPSNTDRSIYGLTRQAPGTPRAGSRIPLPAGRQRSADSRWQRCRTDQIPKEGPGAETGPRVEGTRRSSRWDYASHQPQWK